MTETNKAPEGQVADAVKGNWVDTIAPPWTRPYFRLSRADRPIGTWLLLLPTVWAILLAALSDAPRLWDLWLIIGCAIGAWLMRGAGCTWNDITDRDFDAQVARTKSRPLPSGQVTVRGAVVWMCVQALVAFAILLSFGMPTIAVGIASLFFVCIYPFAKRFTWWPQVFLGLAFNWGALLGWVAHRGDLTLAPILLYLSGIAWTLFYDTIYAHQDAEDDALIGVKSTARLFAERTPIWLGRFMVISSILMFAAVILAVPSGPAQWCALLGAVGYFAHLHWQWRRFDPKSDATLIFHFRSNRDAGLIPVLFFAIALML